MLSERSVALQEQNGPGRGLALSLATLGQILVHLGKLERAEKVLLRALEARRPDRNSTRSPAPCTTRWRKSPSCAATTSETSDYLRKAGDAYGSYGAQTGPWYEWSIRVLEAKLAARRGSTEEALKLAGEIAAHAPPAETIEADLIATETLIAAGRTEEAESRLGTSPRASTPRPCPARGRVSRLRGALHASAGRLSEAYHDIAQSASVFELIGEGYQSARSHLALGRLASRAGARAQGEHQFKLAASTFESLGAARDLIETRQAAADAPATEPAEAVVQSIDADDAIVRRLVDAAAFPELLGHETAAAVLDTLHGDCAVVFVAQAGADVRLVAWTGGDAIAPA